MDPEESTMRIRNVHRASLAVMMAGLGAAATLVDASTAVGIDDEGVHSVIGFEDEDAFIPTGDPTDFFERLVDRYRELRHCSEDVRIERLTIDPESDDPPLRSVVRVVAELGEDQLTVRSSDLLDEMLDLLGPDDVDEEQIGATESELRLLPHLRLRFSPDPLEGFAGGDSEALRPAELEPVTLEGRELVRMELRSGESGASETVFSLFVDPRSMLVERIEGEQWLPGGLHHQTTIRVEAREFESPGDPMPGERPDRDAAPSGDSGGSASLKSGPSLSV